MTLDIFLNDRFYGTLRLDNKRGGYTNKMK